MLATLTRLPELSNAFAAQINDWQGSKQGMKGAGFSAVAVSGALGDPIVAKSGSNNTTWGDADDQKVASLHLQARTIPSYLHTHTTHSPQPPAHTPYPPASVSPSRWKPPNPLSPHLLASLARQRSIYPRPH